MIKLFLAFLSITIISSLGVAQLRKWLKKSMIFDIPNDRSVHSIPTPRGGGLVIVIITLIAALMFAIINQDWSHSLVYLSMAALIAWFGWKDDVYSLSPKTRFFVQGSVAVITIIGLGYFRYLTIPLIGEFYIGVIGIPLTFLWIVGLTNAYNFMDGLDGFSGGVAILIGLGWMWISSYNLGLPNELVFWISFAIGSSSLGFLVHNWPPARIFMGDVASTFLGYTFAVLPLLSVEKGGEPVLVGVVMLWAFILDTGVTFARRIIKHENLLNAHRSHLYQRWVTNGIKPLYVNFIFYFFTILGVFLLWGWFNKIQLFPTLIVIGLPVLWIVISLLTSYKENDRKN